MGKVLSEPLRFSSADIKAWLEHETGSLFRPVHTKAQKLTEEMRRCLESLGETSKMLLDNSAKEIERRNMKTYGRARALNKLAKIFVDRTRQIKVPDKVTYENFHDFVRETQKAFTVTEIDVRNYFPRISPFFILDRRRFLAVFEKAKLMFKELETFLTKDYVKTKTLEETFELIDRWSTLERQLTELNARKGKVENSIALVQKEIMETQQNMAELSTKGSIGQLSQTGTEIDALTTEVKHNLQHLQKPFIKLRALATHGSGSGLTPEELAKLQQYLERPLEALSTEQPGYPLLRHVLEKLHQAIRQDKLKLKPEKARKAEQAINNILNNSLDTLYQRCREATTRKAQLSTSEEVATTQRDLAKLREHEEALVRNRGVLESEQVTINRNRLETTEKIQNVKSEIEENVISFTSKKITLT